MTSWLRAQIAVAGMEYGDKISATGRMPSGVEKTGRQATICCPSRGSASMLARAMFFLLIDTAFGDTWTAQPSMPGSRSYVTGGVIGSNFYVVGGCACCHDYL